MTDHDTACDPLEVALAEYMLRTDLGEAVDREAFAAEHPEAADALREYFRGCAEFDTLTGADPGGAPTPAATDLLPSFGSYDVIEVVGRGGMGVVYKARHVQLNRTVALKTVRAAGAVHPADAGRFLREAEATARLDHPGIVPVYDFGHLPGADGGRAFLAMKWVEGGSLRDRRGWYLPRPRDAARVAATAARAVHHAHQRGILHRDLKPANILLDAAGAPVVSDFGLAEWVGRGRTDRPGLVYGTPGYMAPEQAAADGPEPTTAVDVYGLGAVLYELLTGRPPYPSDTPTGALVQMALGRPPRPRARNPAVPRDLEAVCLKCLAADPRGRYPSAAELADELDRFLAGEPVRARPHGAGERLVKWARRRPAVAALFAAVVLLAVVGLVGILTQWQRAETALDQAEDALATAHAAEAARAAAQAAQLVALADHEWHAGRLDRAERELDDCPPEHRAWEWHHLKRLGRPPARFAAACGVDVADVAFSADGLWLAAGSRDGAVRVKDTRRPDLARVVGGHRSPVTGVAFGPAPGRRAAAGACVASCAAGGSVKMWNAATGAALRDVALPTAGLSGITPHPDGWLVVAVGNDRVVRVWHAEEGREVTALPPHPAAVRATAFGPAPGGRAQALRLATGADDGSVGVFDALAGKRVFALAGHSAAVLGLAFSADGRWLASASADQTVRVWDLTTGRLGAVLVGHQRDAYAVGFDRTGRRVVSAGQDGSVRVWDRETGREVLAFRGHTKPPTRVAVHPDGHRLASGGNDGKVLEWDARERQGQRVFAGHPRRAAAFALTLDGSRVATGGPDAAIRVWDARGPSGAPPLRQFGPSAGAVHVIGFDPPGRRIVSGGSDGKLRLWDAATGQEAAAFEAHTGPVRKAVFSPDGRRLVSAGQDGLVKLWDADTRRELRTLPGHPGGAWCAAFSPDGRQLATGGADSLVRLWDADTGAEVHTFGGHAGTVHWVAFAPDGKRLATGAADQSARVWDVEARRPVVAVLSPGGDAVNGVAFSPDGKRLAVAFGDRTVRLFDPATAREAFVLEGYTGPVLAVAFTADGTGLATAGTGGDLRVWEAEPAAAGP